MSDFPVHPHVRGADTTNGCPTWRCPGSSPRAWGRWQWQRKFPWLSRGSSPRAWGRFSPAHGPEGWPRFIPTCVGQIRRWRRSWHRRPVHPHVRGADDKVSTAAPSKTRFIPTCVGQIRTYSPLWALLTVHPHVRGADGIVFDYISNKPGSSPRAWGRLSVST